MKKQFAIKVAQTTKNTFLAAAKNETSNILKFIKPADCCVVLPPMNEIMAKPALSL